MNVCEMCGVVHFQNHDDSDPIEDCPGKQLEHQRIGSRYMDSIWKGSDSSSRSTRRN